MNACMRACIGLKVPCIQRFLKLGDKGAPYGSPGTNALCSAVSSSAPWMAPRTTTRRGQALVSKDARMPGQAELPLRIPLHTLGFEEIAIMGDRGEESLIYQYIFKHFKKPIFVLGIKVWGHH